MEELIRLDGLALAELIKSKQVSPQEMLDVTFAKIESANPAVNAVVRTREEKAYEEAKHIDFTKPYAGVPILLKDLGQNIEGEITSSGSRLLTHSVSLRDDYYTEKLRAAGFIIIGQTNTPEFGLKNICDPEIYGETRNPWNPNYSSGGSSGGAAAAVASGIVPIGGASDGGGSIRIPASFTGLVGLKPTRGRTPVGPGSGRQWAGAAVTFVVTQTVRDTAQMLDILQVVQGDSAFQVPLYDERYVDLLNKTAKPMTAAYTTKSPVGTDVSEDAEQAVLKTVEYLEGIGFDVTEHEAPVDGRQLINGYFAMNSAETTAMFAKMSQSMRRDLTPDDMELMTWAIYKAGEAVSGGDYSLVIDDWDNAAAIMSQLHETYDVHITPATAQTAPEIGSLKPNETMREQLLNIEQVAPEKRLSLINDMFEPSLAITPFTQLANLTGQPAISLPVHMSKEGLPIGVQLMSAKGREDILIRLAGLLEQSDIWVGSHDNPMINPPEL